MPTFPKLAQPVAPAEAFVAPATFEPARGRAAVELAVKHGLFKPSDIDGVDLGEPALLYVPFWRVAVSVDGFHVGLSTSEGELGAIVPDPHWRGSSSRRRRHGVRPHARAVRATPLGAPQLRHAGAPRDRHERVVHVGAEAAREALAKGEVVDADVDKARAEAIASGMLVRSVSPSSAIYAKYEPKILSSTFCLYPLYYARYSYSGESRRHAGEELFVAVSGRTGEVIASKNPSAVRAVATKLRKLLSFDRR